MTDTTYATQTTTRQALWFLIVGAAAAGVHFVVLVIIVSTTAITPAWANVMAFLVAFVISFLGHFYLTFRHRNLAIDSAVNNDNNKRASNTNNNTSSRLRQISDASTLHNSTTTYTKRLAPSPTKTAPSWQVLFKWFVSSALGFMANQALFVTGLHWFGPRYYMLIWLVVTGVITIMTFTLGKLWAFKS